MLFRSLEISIKTKSAHASQPYNGINAITTLMNVYNNLIAQYPLPKSNEEYITSINLSTITAGDAVNKVPDYATMKLDIRHTSKDKKEDIINNIKKMNENLEIKIIGSGILFETNIESNEIKNYLSVCNEVLSFNPKIVKTVATSDAIYFSAKGIPTALMNPYGDNPHCPNEYATIDGLEKLYEIYKKMI